MHNTDTEIHTDNTNAEEGTGCEAKYLDILHSVWGYPSFRGIQGDIIRSIAQGHDTLGLMPTGGGKSLTFQVPALAKDGVCIVITPLIALMKDQVDNLRRKGVIAAAIYSGMSRREIMTALDNCILGNTKLLYVSPERIASDIFIAKLAHMKVSFITVDEAHCISQWGYDFRPSYLQISNIRRLVPGVPVLALTATATSQVVNDIQDRLGFKERNVFRMSFERKNLAYVVRDTDDKEGELLHILGSMPGSAIVYVRSRRRTKEISELLEKNGISSTFYHAGLEPMTKDGRQKEWYDGVKRVMVATNAFGMGIDKSDVRLVVHIDCPNSVEAYFQEAGRAGRDGDKAYAVLLYSKGDKIRLERRIHEEFPDKAMICQIYDHIAYFFQVAAGTGCGHTFLFDIDKFCRTFKHFPTIADSALRILSRAGYIDYESEPDSRTRMRFIIDRDHLYQLHSNSADEESLISAVLREYSGMFSDYRYIDESRIAQLAGLTVQQVYLILKSLNYRRIIHFIPQRSTPLITYTRDRVLADDIVISHEVYEDRKEQFAARIKAMVGYAMNDTVCRSRQLLRYFGENDTHNCGQCDVCIANKKASAAERNHKEARQAILEFLSDGQRHNIAELRQQGQRGSFEEALRELMLEDVVGTENRTIFMK